MRRDAAAARNQIKGNPTGLLLRWRSKYSKNGHATLMHPLTGQSPFEAQGEVEVVFGGGCAVGGADDGVEGGMGVAKLVGAGDFEVAIELAEEPGVGGRDPAVGARTGVDSEHPR